MPTKHFKLENFSSIHLKYPFCSFFSAFSWIESFSTHHFTQFENKTITNSAKLSLEKSWVCYCFVKVTCFVKISVKIQEACKFDINTNLGAILSSVHVILRQGITTEFLEDFLISCSFKKWALFRLFCVPLANCVT